MIERPEQVNGVTFEFNFDHLEEPIYVTLNFITIEGVKKPYELFINSIDSSHLEWSSIATRLISAIFRQGEDSSFIFKELQESFWIESFHYKGKQYNSILAVIGETLENYIKHEAT